MTQPEHLNILLVEDCEALAEITRGAGRQFDPDAAAAFTDLIASQPERLMPDRYTGDREIEVR
jgi:hypothetical protein